MKWLIVMLSVFTFLSVNAAYENEAKRTQGEIALEAYNFFDGIKGKELTTGQLQLYREGMKRLRELARTLNYKAYESKERIEISGSERCNEFYQLKVQDLASENAQEQCRAEAKDSDECLEVSAKIISNNPGECQALAVVHKVRKL